MKVIALIPQRYASDTMLVEMTAMELGIIVYGIPNNDPAKVGTEVNVGNHWQRVREINDAQIDLNRAAGSLRALADLLETIPVVVPPSDPQPAKEGGAA